MEYIKKLLLERLQQSHCPTEKSAGHYKMGNFPLKKFKLNVLAKHLASVLYKRKRSISNAHSSQRYVHR